MAVGLALEADGVIGTQWRAQVDQVVAPFDNVYNEEANKEQFSLLACVYQLMAQVVGSEAAFAAHEDEAAQVQCFEAAHGYDAVADYHDSSSLKVLPRVTNAGLSLQRCLSCSRLS